MRGRSNDRSARAIFEDGLDFSPSSIRARWEAGYARTMSVLERRPWEQGGRLICAVGADRIQGAPPRRRPDILPKRAENSVRSSGSLFSSLFQRKNALLRITGKSASCLAEGEELGSKTL